MWRRTLLVAAALLYAQSVQAQVSSYPPAGGTGGPALPGHGPGLTPVTGMPTLPSVPPVPTLTPPAPVTAAPSGPNPGLGGAGYIPPPPMPVENTVAFDPDQAELRWQDNRWQLYSGTAFLKDFGRSESEGREVLRVVRELRLTTLTSVGTPRPVMEYWLSNGEAPHGHVAGLRAMPLDAAGLKADQVQGQWCVHDSTRILFNFGQQGDACRQALAAIQRYGFNQVAYVGQVAPVMLVFLNNPATATPATPPANANPNHVADARFPHAPGIPGPANQNPQGVQPQQPTQMPTLPSQPLNPQAGAPAQQPGAVAPAGLHLPGTEAADRVALDSRVLQVRHDGGDWKLAMGNHVIANFGSNQADAQLAQAALRYYRVTEQVFVGNPRPQFSYFLCNGEAPHGGSYAFNAISFRPEALSVRQLGSSYVLYDGTQVLMSFGDRMAEAQQALQAIQHYKFDRMSTFGRGDQSMMLLVRTN
jgi:hypothetical protein